ncbi:MAG: alpha/beta fold hydrolase [Chloroflexi bacterium]|nr:alpha/beta fold hydrolase [Chloroflexota bacterium]
MANTYPILNATEQTVSFTNQGERMWGMLHLPNGKGPHPAVLLLHGITGDKTGAHRLFVHAARALAARGIAALRFDMRGSGDSEGEFQDMTLAAEASDAQVALEWLIGRSGIDSARVGVLGLSLGGMVASMLAGRNPYLVHGLAYWAAAADAGAFMHVAQRTSEKNGTSTDSLMQTLVQNGYIMLWGYPAGLPLIQTFFQEQPLEELKHYPGRAIIVHATGDPTVPVTQADMYAEHFGDRAQVYKLEDSTHTFETPPIERQAIELTVDWFKTLFT